MRRKISLAANVITALCVLGWFSITYAVPYLASHYYAERFMNLAWECDNAMHAEAALRPGTVGARTDHALTISADVELAICHEYDKLRKHLLSLGVSDDRLALHSLNALENEQIPVSRMVDAHRMERF